jgi:hypothetical protein
MGDEAGWQGMGVHHVLQMFSHIADLEATILPPCRPDPFRNDGSMGLAVAIVGNTVQKALSLIGCCGDLTGHGGLSQPTGC